MASSCYKHENGSEDEVKRAIEWLKVDKDPGIEGLTAEMAGQWPIQGDS